MQFIVHVIFKQHSESWAAEANRCPLASGNTKPSFEKRLSKLNNAHLNIGNFSHISKNSSLFLLFK